jgi:hypothetical protein
VTLLRPNLRTSRCGSTVLAVVLLASSVAAPAAATPQTILRGIGNVVLAPVDAALAPVSTFIGIRQNLQDIDDSPGVRLFYPVPAYFYAIGIQLACSWIRLTTGFMEIGVGVLVLPFDTDIDPLFDPVDDADALAEIDIDYMDYPLRFGVNYTVSSY